MQYLCQFSTLQMRSITLVVHALLLISYVYTQTSPRGFELYHKFYELPQGQLKFFYCEIGGVKDVRVEYQDEDVSRSPYLTTLQSRMNVPPPPLINIMKKFTQDILIPDLPGVFTFCVSISIECEVT